MRLLAETMNCKTTSVFDLGLDLLYKVQMTREAGGGPSRQTLGVRNAKEHQGQQLLIISHLIFYHCTEKSETLCDKNLGDQLFSLFAFKTNKRKSRLSSICEIWICASSERACMSGFTGILLIPAPFSRSQKAMFVCVCDQQDEFLMETQTRFQSEILQRCLANASHSHHATETSETLPSEADGQADSTTRA